MGSIGSEVDVSGEFEVFSAPNGTVMEMENSSLKENWNKVTMQFGSHSDELAKTVEDNNTTDGSAPKDAVEEWPAPKQIHSFYFVRHRTYDDPKIKAKLEQADKEINKSNHVRVEIIEELKAKRAKRSDLFAQFDFLKCERDGFNAIFDEKMKELEPLQQALGKLRTVDDGLRGDGLCSSEKELDDLIHSLQYRIQHESISLSEEKQILKEIKQLEGTREKVVAHAAMRAKIQDFLGQKEAIQDQVKLMGVDLNEVKKDRQVVTAKINSLSEKLRAAKVEIEFLEAELKAVTDKRDKAFEIIKALRRQRDEGNANFFQSRAVLNKAREFAANKNINDLEELSNAEVEKFMSLWNCSEGFRTDYEKRILPSLDSRQLSRDGRIRSPEEKSMVAPEAPVPFETQTVASISAERGKEDSSGSTFLQANNVVTHKVKKEASNNVKDSNESSLEQSDISDFDIPQFEKPRKEENIDEARLKEMKKEEELAKARQATERKRKLQEKAAAKAAIRAQKEAEKKLKEREKKAKKKAAASSSPSDPEEVPQVVTEASEPEKVVEVEALAPVKEKTEKERVTPRERGVRYRNRVRGADSPPKAIIKRRKTTNYWVWAVPAAAVALMLLVVAYIYVH